MNYRLLCSCGHAVYRGADSKEAAIERFKQAMDQATLDAHYGKYHQGEAKPALNDLHASLGNMIAPSVDGLSLTLPKLVAPA